MSTNNALIRILLVGDTSDCVSRLQGLLGTNGSALFRISHVPDLELAAKRLSKDKADILLLDIGSKQQGGRELVQAVSAAVPDVPVVVLSDSDQEALAVESLRRGVQDFLAKERLDPSTLARSLRYSIERYRVQQTLQSLSLIDDLTGLQNRRGFLALAEHHLRMILRKGAALLVCLDLDDLKMINDTYGHLEGNRALIVTANILRATFRQSDILARMGGDEFCVLMTDAGQDSAHQVRNRLQQRVDANNANSSSHFRISLSVGITDVPVVRQSSLQELLQTADVLMYEEKRSKKLRGLDSLALRRPATA